MQGCKSFARIQATSGATEQSYIIITNDSVIGMK